MCWFYIPFIYLAKKCEHLINSCTKIKPFTLKHLNFGKSHNIFAWSWPQDISSLFSHKISPLPHNQPHILETLFMLFFLWWLLIHVKALDPGGGVSLKVFPYLLHPVIWYTAVVKGVLFNYTGLPKTGLLSFSHNPLHFKFNIVSFFWVFSFALCWE